MKNPPGEAYEKIKTEARDRRAGISVAGRDIGPPPAIVDVARYRSGEYNLRQFCETYFPAAYYLPFCADHLRIIAELERVVLQGGLLALAMPRGSGKSTLCRCATLWAILYGHRRYVTIIGATEAAARGELQKIKAELSHNDRLLEDFADAVYPIRRLENDARRCTGQLCEGRQTNIAWTVDRLVMPDVENSPSAGSVVTVAGLTGALRGQSHTLPSGEILRPELVLLDDPQTRESANSPAQSATRAQIVGGDILHMGAPGHTLAAVMPCTVICPGDLADRMLNRDVHPEWNGERTQALYALPVNGQLWEEYASMLRDDLRNKRGRQRANDFYTDRRSAMDAGARVAWPERFNDEEVSGLQHCMNVKILNEEAFHAEYQNQPVKAGGEDVTHLTAEEVAQKLNGRARGAIPAECEFLTMAVDVHDRLLYWTLVAWSAKFNGYILDYGSYPDQRKRYYTLRNATRTLGRAAPGAGSTGAIYAGLEKLTTDILTREFTRDDGAQMHVGRCLIDAGYEASTVHQFCRQSSHSAVLFPVRGQGIGAGNKPITDYNRKQGDRIGWHWWIPKPTNRRGQRHLRVDTNHWKSFVMKRLATAMGDDGCLSLWGDNPSTHQLFSEHIVAETAVRTEGHGRVVEEWKARAGVDQHLLDCLVYCAAAASLQGASLPGTAPTIRPAAQRPKRQRQRISYLFDEDAGDVCRPAGL